MPFRVLRSSGRKGGRQTRNPGQGNALGRGTSPAKATTGRQPPCSLAPSRLHLVAPGVFRVPALLCRPSSASFQTPPGAHPLVAHALCASLKTSLN